jgi:hyperosmotically inducible periplasmic protein
MRLMTRLLATSAGVLMLTSLAMAAPSDPWITTKAKMALLTTDGVSANDINVDTVNGKVTLHGTVGSDAEKTKAESVVKGIDGVTGVRNLVQVVSVKRQDAAASNDADVKKRVSAAIDAERDLGKVDVQSVNAGVVLLAGTTPTLSDHLRAVEVASHVDGVKRVASEIKSPDKLGDQEIWAERSTNEGAQASTTRDMWITSSIKMRLLADERTPGMDVNVDTMNGKVTLFGMVPTADAKAAAEENAHKVGGVKSVANQLQVVPADKQEAVQAKDDDVQGRVKDTLARTEDLKNVTVEVQNGVARLSGTVPSQEDRLQAAVAARTTSGVRAVRDDLRVEP